MIFPNEDNYIKEVDKYDIVPVYEEFIVDMETPVSIFKKVDQGRYSYLLESVEGGEQVARYSFIGFDPYVVFQAHDQTINVEVNGETSLLQGEPVNKLKSIMNSLKVKPLTEQPRFFGGAVGYLGYDIIRNFETLPRNQTTDDLGLPDCFFLVTKVVIIFDHVKHTLKITAFIPCKNDPHQSYQESVELIKTIKNKILSSYKANEQLYKIKPPESSSLKQAVITSNISHEKFVENVEKAKEYIKAGDIFQVVLSQRFKQEIRCSSFDIYRALRSVNPSPYMFYLNFESFQIVGSSPEMLVRVEDGLVETHPIAGTRPRGETAFADEALAKELREDSKECAEHLMLVDLGRNDLGRVCDYGTVHVAKFMEVERYSHVMHMVSLVRGKISSTKDAYEALIKCFPAGTVSGAPKIRAMEIIEELEPTKRGPYAGAIGYLSFNGNLDSCITIRTVLIKDLNAYVQTGAGIVADSDPEKEYQETLNKAKALLKALQIADGG